jgi:hypothetical protein
MDNIHKARLSCSQTSIYLHVKAAQAQLPTEALNLPSHDLKYSKCNLPKHQILQSASDGNLYVRVTRIWSKTTI